MEKLEYKSDNYFVNVRITLIAIAIVSFPFNVVGIFTEDAEIGSVNQIVALSTSGLSSIIWLYWHRRYRRDRALSKPTAGVIAIINDLFFAIYLMVIYLTMVIVFWGIREHVVCAYGNLACLVSGLLHAYAALMAGIERYKAYVARMSQHKTVAFCPRCAWESDYDYHIMDAEQEVGVAVVAMSPELGNAESERLIGSDSPPRYPFRPSEDTAVSLGSAFTVETFDGSSAAGQTK